MARDRLENPPGRRCRQAKAKRGVVRAAVSAAIMGAALAATAGPAMAAPVTLPASAPSNVGAAALRVAMTQLGKPYVWGAAGPNAYDCSGLVRWAFRQAGVNLPRTSSTQSTVGKPVSRDQLRPGDLVFFYSPVHHVGIYVGDGRILHASTAGQPVKISSMAGFPFHNARRL
ncbi:MAG TPA: NlpC/P60 family protein [Amycolatopsis sp.]|uniref:C40 family peptidase n=1 Tax=Amycolatopsis sp. TaxID=37632 RepID=UPI002B48FC86|nr:NlpC/P60 family protein [Amycolatopsis sp.]HKS49777.1 NlpC/P60 family protein [Amycolatopsis sp.]